MTDAGEGEQFDPPEHDPDGRWAAKFSDRDLFRHDDLETVFERAEEMYDERDFLTGERNVAVTIGPADAIDFPQPAQETTDGS